MATANPAAQCIRTLTPNLVVRDCAKAIDFYVQALGAQEIMRVGSPEGTIWHAELKIGDSIFFLNDEAPGMSRPAPSAKDPAPVTMWLFVPDADAAHRRAVEAGARSSMEPVDMFWGDRCAEVADPYGYLWSFATHQKDMTLEEIERAGRKMAQSMREERRKSAAR